MTIYSMSSRSRSSNSNNNNNIMRNFIVSNSPVPYTTQNQGANWARNHTTTRMTRRELMNVALGMYQFAGPYSNWFKGGMGVISNRINRIGKLRSKLSRWARTAPMNRKGRYTFAARESQETGRRAKRGRTPSKS
jgi:hypothetical protein